MTTPSSSSLSHALNPPPTVQKSQADLPRLQLAPPEHQKHFQTHLHARQQQETTPHATSSATQRRSDDRATSLASSREVSPSPGVETTHPVTGDKRKPTISHSSNLKRRRTDQAPEEPRDVPLQYGLGTHYPYAYTYPGAPPPPPLPTFHPPPAPNANAEMGFNEFQWRLLNLCGEFYEAATELIRATPHVVLSQAFQLLSRGTGLDPISVLNDARRTCDMLLVNPQALSAAPPPPVALSLPVLTSLAHLNSRAAMTATPTPSVPPPSYYPPHPLPDQVMSGDNSNQRVKEKERPSSNVQGTWKEHEVQKLKALAEKYRVRDKTAVAEEEEEEDDVEDNEGVADSEANTQPPRKVGDVDWDKVVAEFGDERSRHQVLIKATYLGLKPSSSLPGKKPTKKRVSITSTETPPPFSNASAKSIPVGYSHPQSAATGSPSTFPEQTSASPAGAVAPPASAAGRIDTSSLADPQRVVVPPPPVPPAPPPQLTHPHSHPQYAQAGWYPHPQNPYYPYHQHMYYPAHPQSYGMQSYGMHAPPQQGYYGQSYLPPPPPVTETMTVEKQAPTRGKRKEPRKSNGSTSGVGHATSETVVSSPSAPPKPATVEVSSAIPVAMPSVTPLHTDGQGSAHSTPKVTPAVPSTSAGAAPPTTGSSGVLRRGPSNNLFTYTPLPHGPGGTAAEQNK